MTRWIRPAPLPASVRWIKPKVQPDVGDTIRQSYRWRRLSQAIRRQRRVCERCKKVAAHDVHHKIPIAKAPDRAYDPKNLVALCRACHNAEHSVWQRRPPHTP